MVHLPGTRLRRWDNSIRHRLMVLGLGLLAATLLVSSFATLFFSRLQSYRAIAALQREIATTTAERIEALVNQKLDRLRDAAFALRVGPTGAEGMRLVGSRLLQIDPMFAELTIFDDAGKEILRNFPSGLHLSGELEGQRTTAAFPQANRGKASLNAIPTTAGSVKFLTAAVPLPLGEGVSGAMLGAKINGKFLQDLAAEIHFGHGGYAYLLDRNGNLIAPPHDPSVVHQDRWADVTKFRAFLRHPGKDMEPGEKSRGIGGREVFSTYAPISQLDWVVIVEEPVELALADFLRLRWYASGLVIVSLILGAVAIVWSSRKITGPIEDLRSAVAFIGNGNLDHRVEIDTGDELSELGGEINRMAEIVKNSYADLEEKVKQRTRQVSALYEITSALNRSLDLDRVLQEVVERIHQIFDLDRVAVCLFDPERKQLSVRAVFPSRSGESEKTFGDQPASSAAWQVGMSGETMIFDDVQRDPRFPGICWGNGRADDLRFLALLPIKVPVKHLGALCLGGKERRSLTDEELKLLTSMCEQIAAAVDKVNLVEELVTRFRHIEALHMIGTAVSQSLDLGEVLDRAVDKIAKTLAFDAAWIYHFDTTDGLSRMKAFYGLGDDMAASMGLRSADIGVNRRLVETGKRVVFENIDDEKLLGSTPRQGHALTTEFQSAAAFPVRTKEKIIGALHVANRAKRHLKAEDLQLIEAVTQQLGVATENALLFAEINLKTKELAKINQDLLEATRARTEFIAAMSHELRTPLNIVIGSSDLLRDGFFGSLTDGQRDATDKISRNARVLLKMINDVLTISRSDANRISLDISTVVVDEIIEQARAVVEQLNRDNRLDVRWDIDSDIPPLTTDALKIEEILQNLISNAFKFTPAGHIEVRVNNRPDADRVEFTVTDTGIGIAAEDQGRIFNAFEQLKEAHTGHFNGVGLGLNIVRRYLDLLHGDISVQSQPGQGTTFTFSVPRSLQFDSQAQWG